jgi:hypothetical protein
MHKKKLQIIVITWGGRGRQPEMNEILRCSEKTKNGQHQGIIASDNKEMLFTMQKLLWIYLEKSIWSTTLYWLTVLQEGEIQHYVVNCKHYIRRGGKTRKRLRLRRCSRILMQRRVANDWTEVAKVNGFVEASNKLLGFGNTWRHNQWEKVRGKIQIGGEISSLFASKTIGFTLSWFLIIWIRYSSSSSPQEVLRAEQMMCNI